MDKHERTARIDSIDDGGVFKATLATEGEASDGDILSIKGGRIPKRMPMLISHWNDPTAHAGSITEPVKELDAKPPRLRVTGQIEMGGEGALADVRRDIAFMINRHGGAMSIRWDEVDGGKAPIRRVNLASDHPYFVDTETEKSSRKRWGYYWPEWRAMEGSLVALGADEGATIGGRHYATRAAETEGEVSAFWRALAEHAEKDEPDAESKVAALLASMRTASHDAREAGASHAEIATAMAYGVDDPEPIGDFVACSIGDSNVFLPARIAEQLQEEREEREHERTSSEPALTPDTPPDQATEIEVRADQPAPEPEADADQRSLLELRIDEITNFDDLSVLVDVIRRELDQSDVRMREQVRELLNHALGRVD